MFFGEEFAGKNPSVLKTTKVNKGQEEEKDGEVRNRNIKISVSLKDWLEDQKAR